MPSFAISKFTVLLEPLWVSAVFLLLSTGPHILHHPAKLKQYQQKGVSCPLCGIALQKKFSSNCTA